MTKGKEKMFCELRFDRGIFVWLLVSVALGGDEGFLTRSPKSGRMQAKCLEAEIQQLEASNLQFFFFFVGRLVSPQDSA
jgi:hypothetical protein